MLSSELMNDTVYRLDMAIELLKKAQKSLSGAGVLGIWDMLGGGMISSFLKHNSIEDARRYAQEAERILSTIDWSDSISSAPRIEIDRILAFLDIFFDGFVVDLVVQTKISRARQELDRALSALIDFRSRF